MFARECAALAGMLEPICRWLSAPVRCVAERSRLTPAKWRGTSERCRGSGLRTTAQPWCARYKGFQAETRFFRAGVPVEKTRLRPRRSPALLGAAAGCARPGRSDPRAARPRPRSGCAPTRAEQQQRSAGLNPRGRTLDAEGGAQPRQRHYPTLEEGGALQAERAAKRRRERPAPERARPKGARRSPPERRGHPDPHNSSRINPPPPAPAKRTRAQRVPRQRHTPPQGGQGGWFDCAAPSLSTASRARRARAMPPKGKHCA